MTHRIEVYDLRYSQAFLTGRDGPGEEEAETMPSIGTLWSRREADAVAAVSGDVIVVPVMMDEALALSVAE